MNLRLSKLDDFTSKEYDAFSRSLLSNLCHRSEGFSPNAWIPSPGAQANQTPTSRGFKQQKIGVPAFNSPVSPHSTLYLLQAANSEVQNIMDPFDLYNDAAFDFPLGFGF